jgi:hypothetical protein
LWWTIVHCMYLKVYPCDLFDFMPYILLYLIMFV